MQVSESLPKLLGGLGIGGRGRIPLSLTLGQTSHPGSSHLVLLRKCCVSPHLVGGKHMAWLSGDLPWRWSAGGTALTSVRPSLLFL